MQDKKDEICPETSAMIRLNYGERITEKNIKNVVFDATWGALLNLKDNEYCLPAISEEY